MSEETTTMSITKPVLIVLLILSVTASVRAQTATGSIVGTITDQSGAVIPNANLTIIGKGTGITRAVVTNSEGLYSSPALPAGEYEVRVQADGFATLSRAAQVLAGSDTTANMALRLGAASEVVSVDAASAEINYDTHTIAGSIERQSIQELPLNGRNFLQLASLEPGVTIAAGSTSVRNGPITVTVLGGAGVPQPLVTLDGFEINDRWCCGTQLNFSQEMVQEFQLASVNFDLATGSTGVGAINIVTRSGSNDYHGSAFFFYRDHNMAAFPGLARSTTNPDPYFARRDPGVVVSGPLVKDKLFFFSNFERTSQVQAVTVQSGLASFAATNGIFSSPQTYKSLNTRFDYRLSSKHSVFLRYTHDGNNSFGPNGGAPEPSQWLGLANWSDQIAIGLTSSLTPTLVNDIRFAYNYWKTGSTIATASQCVSPCVGSGLPETTVFGTAFLLGNNHNAPLAKILRDYNLQESLSWQKGSHRLRFGAGIQFWSTFQNLDSCDPACLDVVPAEFATSLAGGAANVATYFPNLANTKITSTADVLNLPVYNLPTALYAGVGVGNPVFPGPYNFDQYRHNRTPQFYAQDVWKVSPNLTLNYGLGYSYQSGLFNAGIQKSAFMAPIFGANNLGPTPSNKRDFSPSLGFAWSIGKSGKTVIRGGAGLYWDTVPFYWKWKENAALGPAGNGRLSATAGVFTNIFPDITQFVGGKPVPLLVGSPLPVQTLSTMTLGQFLQIYNQQFGAIAQKISPSPITSGAYTITDLDILKQASEIYPSNFPLMRSYQTSLGIQRDLGHDLTLTADWARRQFENVSLGEVDLNHFSSLQGPVIPKCTAAQLFVVGQECSTGGITVWTPQGRTIYEGLLVKLSKRFSNRYQFTASYAFQNLNNETVVNLNNYAQGYGPSLPRNNLNVSGMVNLPWGFMLSVNSSFISRTPIAPIIPGVDLSGTGAVSAGPLPGVGYRCFNAGCGKNDLVNAVAAWNMNYAGTKGPNGAVLPTITLPSDYQLGDPTFAQDFRLTKTFTYRERYKLSLLGEAFNAFNIANLTGYTFSLNSATFGKPTQRAAQSFLSGGPRAFQIGARFAF
jgi:hypothetical protein